MAAEGRLPRGLTTVTRAFVFDTRLPRVVFGAGALQHLIRELDLLGAKRALVLSTPGQSATAERVASLLGERAAGVFAQAVMHVPTEIARAAQGEARRLGADCAIAIGGGSTIGLGKAIAVRTGAPQLVVPTTYAGSLPKSTDFAGSMIVAPPSANGSPWARKFGPNSGGFASGWMRIRGPRRRRSVDRGFVLSDHADWPGLLSCVKATGATRVLLTHGYTAVLARWLREQGLDASTLATQYEGERDDASEGLTADETAP